MVLKFWKNLNWNTKKKEQAHKEECEAMYHKGFLEGYSKGEEFGRKETEIDNHASSRSSYNSGVNAGLSMGRTDAYLEMKEYIREKLGTEE